MNKKISNMLGLAQRAGLLSGGGLAAESAVKAGKARLLVIAEDASENTQKKFSDMASYRKIPLICCGSCEELGRSIGQGLRSSAAITDQGMADAILKLFQSEVMKSQGD